MASTTAAPGRPPSTWRTVLVPVLALVCFGLAACGSGTPAATSTPSAPGAPASGSTGADGDASADPTPLQEGGYPRTVQTLHGPVTIEEEPGRIVALSFATADALLSLGIHPSAVATNPSTLAASTPWLAARIKGVADGELVSSAGVPNFEAIAAKQPDLILAETWQVSDKKVFDRLNTIAPTVVADSDALNVDWDVRLASVAEAVDRSPKAEQVVARIQRQFKAVGNEVPDISSKTYQWVAIGPQGYQFGNGSIFELFGLKPAANQDNSQNGPLLSKEKTGDLDADLLGVFPRTPALRHAAEQDPLFQQLPAVRNGTVYWSGLAFANAINSPGPLALDWMRAKLAPTVRKLG